MTGPPTTGPAPAEDPNTGPGPTTVATARVGGGRSELATLAALAAIAFLVLFAYSAARPVRDEIAANITSADRADLWKGTFVVNLALAPLYAWIASRSTRARLLGGMFVFFGLCALAFAHLGGALAPIGLGDPGLTGAARLVLEKVFYVWLSVLVMFVVSSTWSLASDLLRAESAARLFGPLAAASSLGGVAGAFVTGRLSEAGVGPGVVMVLMAVSFFAACAPLALLERRQARRDPGGAGGRAIGGTLWSGFAAVGRSRYLLAIAGFVLLMTLASTVFYFSQSELLGTLFVDRDDRRAWLARRDLWVNVASLVGQLGVIGWVMGRAGLGVALALLPLLTALGLAGLVWIAHAVEGGARGVWVAEGLLVLLAVQQVGRYAFARPAREALYTLVTRDERYKSKAFIDTAIYRGGDVLWAEAYALVQGVGLAVAGIAVACLPLVGLWLVGAWYLGAVAERRAARSAEAGPGPAGP